jgi:hypothetical protein
MNGGGGKGGYQGRVSFPFIHGRKGVKEKRKGKTVSRKGAKKIMKGGKKEGGASRKGGRQGRKGVKEGRKEGGGTWLFNNWRGEGGVYGSSIMRGRTLI